MVSSQTRLLSTVPCVPNSRSVNVKETIGPTSIATRPRAPLAKRSITTARSSVSTWVFRGMRASLKQPTSTTSPQRIAEQIDIVSGRRVQQRTGDGLFSQPLPNVQVAGNVMKVIGLGQRDLAELALLLQLPRVLGQRIQTPMIAHGALHPRLPNRRDHPAAVVQGDGHGLFQVHVFRRLRGGDGLLGVQLVGRGDDHRVHVGLPEQFLVIAVDAGRSPFSRERRPPSAGRRRPRPPTPRADSAARCDRDGRRSSPAPISPIRTFVPSGILHVSFFPRGYPDRCKLRISCPLSLRERVR